MVPLHIRRTPYPGVKQINSEDASNGSWRRTVAWNWRERASASLPNRRGNCWRRLSDVLDDYTQAYAVNHRKKSIATVKERLAHVVARQFILSDITATRIVEYMETRLSELTSLQTCAIWPHNQSRDPEACGSHRVHLENALATGWKEE